jgi:hypothetical protein
MTPPEKSAPKVAAAKVRAVTIPTQIAGNPMSSCAAEANTGGANTAIDTSAWMAMVATNGQITPFMF